MAKITVDIEYIKDQLKKIGYEISDCIPRENNGLNWQLKFNNSGASVTIYDSNNVKNTVVNGKVDQEEKKMLKQIIDDIKAKEFVVDPLNEEIISLIRSRKEDYYYDFKKEFHKKDEDLLYDIICLSNNLENRDAYLIIGVTDDFKAIGIDETCKSNNIYDFIKSKKFAGDFKPEIEIKNIYYKYKKLMVIKCKATKHILYYLVERYGGVKDNTIYTRVGDTNTPKDRSASYNEIEKLWRIHFEREHE